jgi:hypothetical protein
MGGFHFEMETAHKIGQWPFRNGHCPIIRHSVRFERTRLMARTAAVFPTVRSEGGLLPPDLLQRIVEADPELGGFAPADYALASGDQVREVISRAWQRVRAFWAAFKAATEDLPPSASGVTETREQWVLSTSSEFVRFSVA